MGRLTDLPRCAAPRGAGGWCWVREGGAEVRTNTVQAVNSGGACAVQTLQLSRDPTLKTSQVGEDEGLRLLPSQTLIPGTDALNSALSKTVFINT